VDEKPKPTIDERLEAIGEKLELLTMDVHEMQDSMKRLDRRERVARYAIIQAMQGAMDAYLRALGEGDDGAAD
jgi:hypothetical protein